MTRTQRIVTAALAAIVAAIILLWTPAQETWGEENTPPVIGTPTSTSLQYLFPRGEKAVLEFSSEPVTDTVWFVFTVPDISTPDNNIDTTKTNNPAEALFKVTTNGNNFEFTAKDGVTPEDFTALYGNVVSHNVPVKMYANDGNQDSLPLSFTITAYHDASPQFHHSATYQSKQRWDTDTVIEVYEGPQVSKMTDALQVPWTSTTEGTRTWTLGNRDGTARQPENKVQGPKRGHHHPHLGPRKAARTARCSQSTSRRETNSKEYIPLRFTSPPDYETPQDKDKDNEYLVRLVSRHDIHGFDGKSPTMGCDGSALDLKIRIKDVGPPAPPTGLTLTLDTYKLNQFKMNWDHPHANQFIENGTQVDFPDPSFNVNRLLMYHEPEGLQFDGNPILNPTQYYAITSGHQNIKGTPGVTYTITARLRNSEGLSDLVSAEITPLGPPAIPESPTVSPESETSISVMWGKPENNGGKPITGYEVQYQKEGADRWETLPHTGTGTSTIITSLVRDVGVQRQDQGDRTNLGSSDWSPTGKGRTVGLVVQITSSGNITSGNDAVFTVTLSKAATVTVNLTHTWTGGYGKSDPGTLKFTGETSKNYTLRTARGSPEADGGSVTVTIDTDTTYEIGTSGSATVNIKQDPSSQPTLASPSNQGSGAVYKFPAGKTDGIKYDSEPGTDLDMDTLAYLITFTNPKTNTEVEVTIPAEGTAAADLPGTLLTIERSGDNFIFEPDGNVTPDQFETTYGNVESHHEEKTLEVQLWASDGTERSHPVDFTLRLHYDPSGYFAQPAENRSISRWDLPDAIEISEGTSTISGATVMWASPLAGTRNWATGNPTTPVSCRHGLADPANQEWPDAGNEDSDLFTLDTSTTTDDSGSITFSFKDPPDFESPSDSDKDNTYRLRLHNIHSLHQATGDQVGFPACSGSAIDITVIVINVNEPPTFPSKETDARSH